MYLRGASVLLPLAWLGSSAEAACTVTPCAAPLTGDIGLTTVGGRDARTGKTFAVGESIKGPFEGGFDGTQSGLLTSLGCSPASNVFVDAGIDVWTAERMVALQCGVTLPREEDNEYISLVDECGAQGPQDDYHFHEGMTCLYNTSAHGHSPKIGETIGHGSNSMKTAIYGKWEDQDSSNWELPALDACNGHFGPTPESNGANVYHYHTSGLPPFTIGCFGPDYDTDGTPMPVSPMKCHSLYPECSPTDLVQVVVQEEGAYNYNPWCPCFFRARNAPASPPAPPALPITPSATPSPPPSATPSPPPSATPSPPPSTTPSPPPPSPDATDVPWKDCTPGELTGDMDGSGVPTLGDAVHIALERLRYGETGINHVRCMKGDFDSDGTFTINDAAFVAMAQFGLANYIWDRQG